MSTTAATGGPAASITAVMLLRGPKRWGELQAVTSKTTVLGVLGMATRDRTLVDQATKKMVDPGTTHPFFSELN